MTTVLHRYSTVQTFGQTDRPVALAQQTARFAVGLGVMGIRRRTVKEFSEMQHVTKRNGQRAVGLQGLYMTQRYIEAKRQMTGE